MRTARELMDALIEDPFDSELRFQLARTLLAEGDLAGAAKHLALLVRQEPAEPRWAEWLARVEGLQGPEPVPEPAPESAPEPADAPEGPALKLVSRGPDPVTYPLPDPAPVHTLPAPTRVSFDQIVGMEKLKRAVRLKIVDPFLKPGLFQRFGKRGGGGILLYGPPGCGKTMLARAIASECSATFVHVGISDVLNMYIGESEHNLRAVFDEARHNAPSVLFFDELDALAIARGKTTSTHSRTLVNELLSQLDGFGGANEQVLVLGATNMPWDVDAAAKRPGRFSKSFFVPPPDAEARVEMFRVRLAPLPTAELDLDAIGRATELFSGADVDGVVEDAKERVLDRILETGDEDQLLTQADLVGACADHAPTCADWLKTAANLVKFGGVDKTYKPVADYLKSQRLF